MNEGIKWVQVDVGYLEGGLLGYVDCEWVWMKVDEQSEEWVLEEEEKKGRGSQGCGRKGDWLFYFLLSLCSTPTCEAWAGSLGGCGVCGEMGWGGRDMGRLRHYSFISFFMSRVRLNILSPVVAQGNIYSGATLFASRCPPELIISSSCFGWESRVWVGWLSVIHSVTACLRSSLSPFIVFITLYHLYHALPSLSRYHYYGCSLLYHLHLCFLFAASLLYYFLPLLLFIYFYLLYLLVFAYHSAGRLRSGSETRGC